jgi:predicted TIM-barrel fold metal-dependent hydrolase
MLPIVDLHCHYLAQDPEAPAKFRRLIALPEVLRVVVCALDLRLPYCEQWPFMGTFATTNEQLAAFIEEMGSEKLVPFCHIDPLLPEPDVQAEYWIRERGMRGIKLYPPSGWYPNDPRVMPVYRLAEEAGVPILMHMGRVATHPALRSEYARPIYLEEVGTACPQLKLIIGHFAAPWSREAMHIAMSFPNFMFDLTTSGSADLHLLRMATELPWLEGLRRIVLGTDGDGGNNLTLARATLDRLTAGGFRADELEAIAWRNAMTLLGES